MKTLFGKTVKHIGKVIANCQGFVKMTAHSGKLNALM